MRQFLSTFDRLIFYAQIIIIIIIYAKICIAKLSKNINLIKYRQK